MFLFYKRLKDRFWGNRLFCAFAIFCLLLVFIFDFRNFFWIVSYFYDIFLKVLWPLFLVYLLILFFNLFSLESKFKKLIWTWSYFRKNIFVLLFGIISSGPIYLWYGLLKRLNDSGLTSWHIATFSYARAIKLPMLPIMMSYFWFRYSLLFILVLLFLSFFQSYLVDYLLNKKKSL